MRDRQMAWPSGRVLLALMTLLVTYFSVVSTFTNTRVSGIEEKTEKYSEKAVAAERNIAVILEKIENIEVMLMMLRDEVRQQSRDHGIQDQNRTHDMQDQKGDIWRLYAKQ